MTPTMRACVITAPGGPDVLEIREVARPAPGPDEVLVRVMASALNRADLLQRLGRYPAPAGAPADIPGLEFAGEIVELGAHVDGWRAGDRVFGIVAGGAHAEYLVVDSGSLATVPAALSWTVAGATPEAFITAHDALCTIGRLHAGERLLIHAIGSGVGLASAQLGRLIGATVYGTARTPHKLETARGHGLSEGLVTRDGVDGIADAVKGWSGGLGVEVVLDLVGGPFVPATLPAMAPRGRYVLVGLVAGASATIDLGRLLRQRVQLTGTVLRARSRAEKAAATAGFVRDVVPGLAAGTLCPVIEEVLPLERIAEAHALLEGNGTTGKVAITMG
jgi:putative PIG3 family NAD(P)H quinone oxidoreductase